MNKMLGGTVRGRKQSQTVKKAVAMIVAKIMSKIIKDLEETKLRNVYNG